jgi:arylsulfatase A-like enzyme
VFIDTDGEILAAEAVRHLTERAAEPRTAPSFTWLHFIEPHNWMKRKDGRPDKYSAEDTKPGADGRDARARRYDRALAEVDGFLGDLLAAVEAMPEDRRPIIVVTSDHGEGLGNHGSANHSSDLYESQIHVPLVIAVPGAEPRRIDEPVSLTDLAPTLLDLLGFEPPTMPDMDGRSLVDLILGARAPDPNGGYAFAAMIKDRSTPKGARAIVRGPYKLIDGARGLELYDVLRDPGEEANLYDSLPEVAGPMKALLDERHAIDSRPPF